MDNTLQAEIEQTSYTKRIFDSGLTLEEFAEAASVTVEALQTEITRLQRALFDAGIKSGELQARAIDMEKQLQEQTNLAEHFRNLANEYQEQSLTRFAALIDREKRLAWVNEAKHSTDNLSDFLDIINAACNLDKPLEKQ